MIPIAVRLILDRADSTDEAITLLKKFDIHTVHGYAQHLFIADKSGKSVVAEWTNNNINIIETNICTNFTFSEIKGDDFKGNCYRFDILEEKIKNKPENTPEDAMYLLQTVRQNYDWIITEWSTVYHLNDFSMDIVVDQDYDTVHKLTREDFK